MTVPPTNHNSELQLITTKTVSHNATTSLFAIYIFRTLRGDDGSNALMDVEHSSNIAAAWAVDREFFVYILGCLGSLCLPLAPFGVPLGSLGCSRAAL